MKENKLIDKLMKSARIKGLGLKREAVESILKEYEEIAFKSLLENGYVDIGNGMTIEIIRISDRVHVLRGVTYKSTRKYKLKLTMMENIYNRIESYYDELEKEIL